MNPRTSRLYRMWVIVISLLLVRRRISQTRDDSYMGLVFRTIRGRKYRSKNLITKRELDSERKLLQVNIFLRIHLTQLWRRYLNN